MVMEEWMDRDAGRGGGEEWVGGNGGGEGVGGERGVGG